MPIYNAHIKTLNKNEVKRYAGIRKAEDFPEKYVDEACLEAKLLSVPRSVYQEYDYDEEHHTILSNPPLVLTGKSIINHLKGATKVFVFSATVGEAIELRSHELFKENQYTTGLLLDAAATTAVEEVADQVNELLNTKAAKQGFKTTWRFSPGYGDWPIEIQPELAAIIKASDIGVTVTDSYTLFPRKSVTAIIGLSPQENTALPPQGCPSCAKLDCESRRT